MKCDELKVYHCNEWHNEYTEFYMKSDVDSAIDELKAEHHKERHEYIEMVAQLKAKLEDAGMRERKMKRALYKACANWALSTLAWLDCIDQGEPRKWSEMVRKCRAKAEEYK